MATLRAAWLLVIFLAMTLLLLPVQVIAVRLGLGLRRRLPRFYHRIVCRLIGLRVSVTGTPVEGGVLMAANHLGWLDIPILSTIAPLSFVAKQEVGSWAFFGTLARLQRTIFIRRERAKAAEDRDTIRRRLAAGETLVIFPEGTSSDGNRVLPFKSSLFSAAELTLGEDAAHHVRHVPVQPVSVAYVGLHGMPMGRETRPFFAWYGDMELVPHFWEAFWMGPIDVAVELHKPVTIDEAGDRKRLAAAVETAVRAGVIRALHGREAAAAEIRNEELIEALRDDEPESEEAA
jgi:1-acyl-sn-glycerol-3-phosphate acyltransferase